MPPLVEYRLEQEVTTNIKLPTLVSELERTALDPSQWPVLDGLLRALTRSVLDEAARMSLESIEPYERALVFAAGQLAGALEDKPLHGDPRYILGRIDALLDTCDVGLDRSVSKMVLESARERRHVYPILDRLREVGETRASDLADAVGIKPNHLSNILKWMEETGLVRRAAVGRSNLVSLGPKGSAVYSALRPDNIHGTQVEDFELAAPDPAHAEPTDAVEATMSSQFAYAA